MTFSYLSQMPFKSKISRGGIRQNVGRTGAGPDGISMNTLEQNEKNRLRMMHSRAKAKSVDYSSVHPEASSTYLSVTTRDVQVRNIKNMYDLWHCTLQKLHYISNRNFCCFSYIIAMVHQNSPTVEFWQEKIEGNLRRANTEPSVDFRRANTEPSVDFRKANTEPSVHFRRANTETY